MKIRPIKAEKFEDIKENFIEADTFKKYISIDYDIDLDIDKLTFLYYKGNKLYNIKKVNGLNYCRWDIMANWKDKDDNNKEKLGYFYLKDLTFDK